MYDGAIQAATTAALGVVALSSGAAAPIIAEMNPIVTSAPTVTPVCPEIPVETRARIKLSFARNSDSLAVDLIEGNGDWEKLEDEIVKVYNDISEDCYETHQRRMINCSYQFSEYNIESNDLIDTYWMPFVICNNSCPVEDPDGYLHQAW